MADPDLPTLLETHETSAGRVVSLTELFLGFLKCGLLGFGGVAPWARHIIVEERRWFSERDYAALLGVGQALPGANVVNTSVMIGDKFQGPAGSLVCLAGLMAVPLAILIVLATFYASFADNPLVEAAMAGAAAAAAGLIFGTAAKMIRALALSPAALACGAAACIAIGILGWPFVPVLLVLIPASIAAAYAEHRR